jgi:hypothetical protein
MFTKMTPEELAAAGGARVAGNVLAREVIAAGAGSAENIATANAAGAAAYLAQREAEAAGASREAQATAARLAAEDAALKAQAGLARQKAINEARATGASDAEALKAGDAAAKEVMGSNTIYYVAAGLVAVGLIGTFLLTRKRSPAFRPALAGVNRRRKARKSRRR